MTQQETIQRDDGSRKGVLQPRSEEDIPVFDTPQDKNAHDFEVPQEAAAAAPEQNTQGQKPEPFPFNMDLPKKPRNLEAIHQAIMNALASVALAASAYVASAGFDPRQYGSGRRNYLSTDINTSPIIGGRDEVLYNFGQDLNLPTYQNNMIIEPKQIRDDKKPTLEDVVMGFGNLNPHETSLLPDKKIKDYSDLFQTKVPQMDKKEIPENKDILKKLLERGVGVYSYPAQTRIEEYRLPPSSA